MQPVTPKRRHMEPWREHLYQIIFESGTAGGRAFDIVLLISIFVSVAAVSLESLQEVRDDYGTPLRWMEWTLTALFTAEYILRLVASHQPGKYARSFFGVVDLLAILPSYLGIVLAGAHSLIVIRVLRLLRVFRILKMPNYLGEANLLVTALKASRPKITVFLTAVLTVVVIFGSLMHLVEGEKAGFTSVPRSMYWTVVTLTTVGYGDIAPKTELGQFCAMLLMILGYGVIAVPTGIVSVELAQATRRKPGNRHCPTCDADSHDNDARHCKYCGATL